MKFALIGHPVGHSLSPLIHGANFAALGVEGSYDKFDVPLAQLGDTLRRLVDEGYEGFNVTVPHKRNVIPFMARLDESASRYDAVNTIKVESDGSLVGYNTDVYGFIRDLDDKHVEFRSKHVLVVGAGGAGRAIAMGLMENGAGDVTLANRSGREGLLQVDSPLCRELAKRVELLVNATPVGLKKEDPPFIAKECFKCSQTIYDLSPVKERNGTFREAFVARARYLNGLGMLVRQAARAFEIWTGRKADVEAMERALEPA